MLDAVSIDSCRLLIQTLGHSLWQAGVVAALCWLMLRSLPARKAGTRYAVTCGGLLIVVFATLLTAATVMPSVEPPEADELTWHRTSDRLVQTIRAADRAARSHHANDNAPPNDDHATHSEAHPDRVAAVHGDVADFASSNTPTVGSNISLNTVQRTDQSTPVWPAIVVGLWGFGVLAMLFRLSRVIVGLRKLQPSHSPIDDSVLSQLREIIADLSQRMNLRWPVALVVSDKVLMPGIVGTLWPTLLMPPAMLTGMPIEQLKIVIAHELAHVRRFDFLVNLGQLLVESLLFFNPAVWWLSRQIRIEREACCDAVAVEATGSALPVARTLLSIVERLREPFDGSGTEHLVTPVGVQSLAGSNPDGSSNGGSDGPLLDRVRRIVTPDQRPHVRVPWYTLLGVVAAYGLVAFGLYEGADVAAQIVERALSPKERVEKIEELIAAKGELARSEGVTPTSASDRQKPGEAFPEAVTVSGTVRTADGQALPKGLTVFGTMNGLGYSGAEQFGRLDEEANLFRFTGTTVGQKHIQGDTAVVSLDIQLPRNSEAAKRYAPAAAGPFEVRSGQQIEDIEIVLQLGFPGQLRVTNADGEAISNAFLSGHFMAAAGQSSANLNPSSTRTDAAGLTTIPLSTSDLTWRAAIRAAGYQTSQFDLKLQRDQPAEVVLKRATPVTVVVTSSVDDRPVAGVRAFVTSEHFTRDGRSFGMFVYGPRDSDPTNYEAKSAPLHAYGPSDADGRIALDSLADGTRYELLFLTPGFGEAELTDVDVRQSERALQIAPALSVTGRIIGDLSGFRSKPPYIQYQTNRRSLFRRVNVELRDGVAHFRLEGLSAGPLTLTLPDRRVEKVLTESLDDLVIDLDQPPEPPTRTEPVVEKLPVPQGAKRRVILNLTGADPGVPISGKFRAGYLTRATPDSYSSADLDIVDGRVEYDVEVPTKIVWTSRSFTGYSVVGRSEIEVAAGDEPFQLDVPLLAGGAVRGVVRLPDGSLASRFNVDLRPVERKSKYRGADERIDGTDSPGEFLLTGVPFDEDYRLLITDSRTRSVAAIVSEPFSLTKEKPIADLKFQFEEGRTHVIQLEDEARQPAIGAKVGGWFNPGLGFIRSIGWGVNDKAQVVLEHVSDSIPGETTVQIEAAGPFRGQKLAIEWSALPDKVVVQRGVSAAGRLVDDATGRGVVGASFFLFPSPSTAAEFRDAVWGRTDDEGRFSFECLEPINYQLNIHGAVPPRVPFKKNNRGLLEPDFSNLSNVGFPEWNIRGGNNDPVELRIKLTPRSRLKLAAEGSNEN